MSITLDKTLTSKVVYTTKKTKLRLEGKPPQLMPSKNLMTTPLHSKKPSASKIKEKTPHPYPIAKFAVGEMYQCK